MAGKGPRWLQEDAFRLQLRETYGSESMFTAYSNPALAQKWFVGLCLYRFSPQMQRAIRKACSDTKSFPMGSSLRMLFFNLMSSIFESPEEYPFCLSDQELVYYSKQNFGDIIPNVDGIYRPPNFYNVLLEDILGVAGGAIIGAGAQPP